MEFTIRERFNPVYILKIPDDLTSSQERAPHSGRMAGRNGISRYKSTAVIGIPG